MAEFEACHLYSPAVLEGLICWTGLRSKPSSEPTRTRGGNAMILISGLKQLQNIAAFHNEERNHSSIWEEEGEEGGEEGGKGGGEEGKGEGGEGGGGGEGRDKKGGTM